MGARPAAEVAADVAADAAWGPVVFAALVLIAVTAAIIAYRRVTAGPGPESDSADRDADGVPDPRPDNPLSHDDGPT